MSSTIGRNIHGKEIKLFYLIEQESVKNESWFYYHSNETLIEVSHLHSILRQCRATIGPPAKCHSNGILLESQWQLTREFSLWLEMGVKMLSTRKFTVFP